LTLRTPSGRLRRSG